MLKPQVTPVRGLLNMNTGHSKFQLARYLPSEDLSFFVEHYWTVAWDLRDQSPYRQENLAYPSVHLVFEENATRIVGIVRGKFVQILDGQGHVFGIKFRPGAFYPFIKSPVSLFTDSSLSLEAAFGVDSKVMEARILSLDDHAMMIALAESFLRERLPERDENVELINQIVERIIADRDITRVDDVVKRFHLSKRTLQRLFSQYVGASPKWTIQRYRLHEAAEQLAEGRPVDCPKLALDLGYFDQAHFIKDFKTIVGRTPTAYARTVSRA